MFIGWVTILFGQGRSPLTMFQVQKKKKLRGPDLDHAGSTLGCVQEPGKEVKRPFARFGALDQFGKNHKKIAKRRYFGGSTGRHLGGSSTCLCHPLVVQHPPSPCRPPPSSALERSAPPRWRPRGKVKNMGSPTPPEMSRGQK